MHLLNQQYTRSVRKVSGLPLYIRAIVFERPLLGTTSTVKPHKPIGCLLTFAGRIAHAQRVFVYKAIFEFGGFCDC